MRPQRLHIMHGEHLKYLPHHQPNPLLLLPVEYLLRRQHVPRRHAFLVHGGYGAFDVFEAGASGAGVDVEAAEIEVCQVEFEDIAQKHPRLQLINQIIDD